MTVRTKAPLGAPCWVDLWTSDIDGSCAFYGELFGWEAGAPDPQFGGYFIFKRDGVDIAGCMGDMGPDMPATDTWKPYLATDDIAQTVVAIEAHGGTIYSPPMPVGPLGQQAVFGDPTGAALGVWEAGTFPGFTVMDEPGSPSWFELHTNQHAVALKFYQDVFGWETQLVADSDEFRYHTMSNPDGGPELAGLMDASSFIPEGQPPYWTIYWEVADADASVEKVTALGGLVVAEPQDTPYGRITTVRDPAGAEFRLRVGPK
jgi:uncharacterized protein